MDKRQTQADGEYIKKSDVLTLAKICDRDGNMSIDAYEVERMLGVAIPSAEPREVLYSGDGYADGYMVYDMAECPNCGYEYEDGDKDWGLSFCPSCGQKLDWESEDKE